MNQKELNEIRRRIRPERNSIRNIYGCYVNGNREIISYLDESLGLLTKEEAEKYLALLKKTLSGTLGRNLLDLSFATKQVMDSEEHRLLSQLRKTELKDAALRDVFYKAIIESLNMEDRNYLILMAFDAYDVPRKGRSGDIEDSGEVFKYILCCVCPVKSGRAELGYEPEDRRFHSATAGQIVCPPELGFLFPAFDERSANIYNALFYTKNTMDIHQEFIDSVFRTRVPMSAGQQRETFGSILSETLEKDCRFDVIQGVHEQLSERISLHKESRDPEPLIVSPEELGDILENSGASPEEAELLCGRCREQFEGGEALRPANLIDGKRLEICTPEVKISLDPKFGYLVQTRVIDGRKYILVSADSGVEVNGIGVTIEEE